MDRLDLFVVGSALACFALFLVAHVVVIRYVRPESSLNALMRVFVAGLALDGLVILWVALGGDGWLDGYPAAAVIAAGAVGAFIYCSLAFIFVTCIFNLGETARRIRLLRELDRGPREGMTLEEIYTVYNANMILDVRLGRLVRAGQLRFDGEAYRVGSRFFLLQARSLAVMRRILGVSEEKL